MKRKNFLKLILLSPIGLQIPKVETGMVIYKHAQPGPTMVIRNDHYLDAKRYALTAAMEQGFKDNEMFLNASIDKKIRQNIMIYGAYPWRYPIT